MKQALKQSLTLALKTTLPTGLLASLIIYLLRCIVFYESVNSMAEELSLFSLVLVAVCCTIYLTRFLIQSIRYFW